MVELYDSMDAVDTYARSYSGYSSNPFGITPSVAKTIAEWALPAIIISLVVAVLVYFLFLSRKNDGKFKGAIGWLYDFLTFKKLTVEGILKILYMTVALYITIMSFTIIGTNFAAFLLMLIGGNIAIRVVYEVVLVFLIICRNTSEINDKLSKKD